VSAMVPRAPWLLRRPPGSNRADPGGWPVAGDGSAGPWLPPRGAWDVRWGVGREGLGCHEAPAAGPCTVDAPACPPAPAGPPVLRPADLFAPAPGAPGCGPPPASPYEGREVHVVGVATAAAVDPSPALASLGWLFLQDGSGARAGAKVCVDAGGVLQDGLGVGPLAGLGAVTGSVVAVTGTVATTAASGTFVCGLRGAAPAPPLALGAPLPRVRPGLDEALLRDDLSPACAAAAAAAGTSPYELQGALVRVSAPGGPGRPGVVDRVGGDWVLRDAAPGVLDALSTRWAEARGRARASVAASEPAPGPRGPGAAPPPGDPRPISGLRVRPPGGAGALEAWASGPGGGGCPGARGEPDGAAVSVRGVVTAVVPPPPGPRAEPCATVFFVQDADGPWGAIGAVLPCGRDGPHAEARGLAPAVGDRVLVRGTLGSDGALGQVVRDVALVVVLPPWGGDGARGWGPTPLWLPAGALGALGAGCPAGGWAAAAPYLGVVVSLSDLLVAPAGAGRAAVLGPALARALAAPTPGPSPLPGAALRRGLLELLEGGGGAGVLEVPAGAAAELEAAAAGSGVARVGRAVGVVVATSPPTVLVRAAGGIAAVPAPAGADAAPAPRAPALSMPGGGPKQEPVGADAGPPLTPPPPSPPPPPPPPRRPPAPVPGTPFGIPEAPLPSSASAAVAPAGPASPGAAPPPPAPTPANASAPPPAGQTSGGAGAASESPLAGVLTGVLVSVGAAGAVACLAAWRRQRCRVRVQGTAAGGEGQGEGAEGEGAEGEGAEGEGAEGEGAEGEGDGGSGGETFDSISLGGVSGSEGGGRGSGSGAGTGGGPRPPRVGSGGVFVGSPARGPAPSPGAPAPALFRGPGAGAGRAGGLPPLRLPGDY